LREEMAIKRYSNKNILDKLNAIEKKIDSNYDQDSLRFEVQLLYTFIAFAISFFAVTLASLSFIYKNFTFLLLAIISFIGSIIFFIFAIIEYAKVRKMSKEINTKKPCYDKSS
jgi:pilus assembly protein TadC